MFKVTITTSDAMYEPAVLSGLTWETVRKSTPGKLKFSVMSDPSMTIPEGSVVKAYDGETGFFWGYVFTTQTTGDGKIDITAYDQLRYFKNKDSRSYKSKTADALLKTIAKDYGLSVGKCDATGIALTRVEDDEELFGMMENAIYDTLTATSKLYVLYDDFGKLRLSDFTTMEIPILIGDKTSGGYTYTSSIDGETYNRIKLAYTDSNSDKKTYFVSEDTSTQKKWGLLQKYEKINSLEGAQIRADSMLKLYNTPVRTLKFRDCFGDIRVRAGSCVLTRLSQDAGYNYMLVEKATHRISEGVHLMDLTLKGGVVNG